MCPIIKQWFIVQSRSNLVGRVHHQAMMAVGGRVYLWAAWGSMVTFLNTALLASLSLILWSRSDSWFLCNIWLIQYSDSCPHSVSLRSMWVIVELSSIPSWSCLPPSGPSLLQLRSKTGELDSAWRPETRWLPWVPRGHLIPDWSPPRYDSSIMPC